MIEQFAARVDLKVERTLRTWDMAGTLAGLSVYALAPPYLLPASFLERSSKRRIVAVRVLSGWECVAGGVD